MTRSRKSWSGSKAGTGGAGGPLGNSMSLSTTRNHVKYPHADTGMDDERAAMKVRARCTAAPAAASGAPVAPRCTRE